MGIVNRKFLNIGIRAVTYDKGNVWISCCNVNALCVFNFDNNTFEFVHRFDCDFNGFNYLHEKIIAKDEKLFCFPGYDSFVRIYSYKDCSEEKIEIPDYVSNIYFQCIQLDDRVYLLNESTSSQCFDLHKEQFRNDDTVNAIINNIIIEKQDKYIFCCNNRRIYMYACDANELFVIDDCNGCYTKENIAGIDYEISKIEYIQGKLWLISKDTFDLYSYDVKEGKFQKYLNKNNVYVEGRGAIPYKGIVEYNGDLYVLNYYAKYLSKINGEVIEIIDSISDRDVQFSFGAMCSISTVINNRLYIWTERGKDFLVVESNGNIGSYKSAVAKDSCIFDDILSESIEKEIVLENSDGGISLADFIDSIL